MSNFIATTRPSKNLFNMFATAGITPINANTFTVKVASINSSGQTTNTLSEIIPSLQVGDIIYVNYNCNYEDWEELRFGITTKAPKNTPITVTQYMLDNPIRFYRKTSGTEVDIEIKNLIITKDSNTSYEPFGNVIDRHSVQSGRKSTNLFDKNSVSNGYTDSNGNVEVVNWYRVSDYIDVGGLDYITYYNTCESTSTLRKFCFYDSNKTFISAPGSEDINKPVTLAVPQNAKYFRMPVSPTYLDVCQVNAGTKVLPYEPYGYNGYIFSKSLISTKEVNNNV